MNSRERFLETMRYGRPDRVPCFEEGIRKEVLKTWRGQGLKHGSDLYEMFAYDRLEEIEPDLEPRPGLRRWPSSQTQLNDLKERLNPAERGRLPWMWRKKVRDWQNRDHVLMLRAHHGFFLSMGVEGWTRFREVVYLTMKDPDLVRKIMMIQGRFTGDLAERVLRDVDVDAALFSEPIASNHGPLISPRMYEDLVLPSFEPVLEVLNRYGVKTIIFRSFANPRLLLPGILKWGFNCLWAFEVNNEAMDYRDLRREFGRDLRLIGGIDLDALRKDRDAIQREMDEKVPSLLADGGYIPLVDGRVREDVPFANYTYYRRLLEKYIRADYTSSFSVH